MNEYTYGGEAKQREDFKVNLKVSAIDLSLNPTIENLTWEFEDWRLYVAASDEGRWYWNLRDKQYGWEVDGTEDFREDAIIQALNAAQSIHFDKYPVDYRFNVAGEEIEIKFNPSVKVGDAISIALSRTGRDPSDTRWQLHTKEGFFCEPTYPIQVYGRNGKELMLSLKAGVGA